MAEVDLMFLRLGCIEAKQTKQKQKTKNRKQELTGKEVAKKFPKKSGPALRKEAKQH